MENWRAVRKGVTVKVWFKSEKPGRAVSGESLRVLVESVSAGGVAATFRGTVLDKPEQAAHLAVTAGDVVTLPVTDVEEVLP